MFVFGTPLPYFVAYTVCIDLALYIKATVLQHMECILPSLFIFHVPHRILAMQVDRSCPRT